MAFQLLRRKKGSRKARLGVRRKKVSTVKSVATIIMFFVFAGITIWAVHLEQVTISTVYIEGTSVVSRDAIENIVTEELKGTYLFLIPRANTFLLPYKRIERGVKNSFLRIEDVAITKNNLATVTITVSEREPFALWCGEEHTDTKGVFGTCYFLDEYGYVFAKSPDFSGSIFLKYFGFLEEGNGQGGLDPIGKYFASPDFFVKLNNFLSDLRNSNVVPVSLTLSEFDIEVAFEDDSSILFSIDQNLETIFDNYQSIKKSDVFAEDEKKGTKVDYIDLRFGNKIFYKFK